MEKNVTNEELQRWIERVSMRDFRRPFRHKARWNARLSTTGGRYLLKSHDIEINPKQYAINGAEEVEKIIKHELCHYHLHLAGRGYQHRDADFKQLLAAVGGSRYCKSMPDQQRKRSEPYRYQLVCHACGQKYMRKRKVDIRKYACGVCRGKLKQEALV
ncbi:SprT family protein [Paenibacillus marinisediminis]